MPPLAPYTPGADSCPTTGRARRNAQPIAIPSNHKGTPCLASPVQPGGRLRCKPEVVSGRRASPSPSPRSEDLLTGSRASPRVASLHADTWPGEGAPIVLLHGVLDAPDSWSRVARRLRDTGRAVMVVHARAHGRSPPWERGMDWSPLADAEDVADLLHEKAPEGAHLVGHSRGGTTASWLAVEWPHLAQSLAIVASPPVANEVFRARFRERLARAEDARSREALDYLSGIPEDDFPQHALRRYRGPALVVEVGDDALYSPTHTMFWRLFLPYAELERVESGGHRFFADHDDGAAWLARRILRHVHAAETNAPQT